MDNVRIPPLVSIPTAIKIYYSYIELGNDEVKELFGPCSSATITRLKGRARERMIELKAPSWNAHRVNTKIAFEAWGLDINDLEYRNKKLQELSTEQATSIEKIPEFF